MDLTDKIGEHLADPSKYPDDAARVNTLINIPLKGVGLDIGCSDGAVITRWVAKHIKDIPRAYAIDTRDVSWQVMKAAQTQGLTYNELVFVRVTHDDLLPIPPTISQKSFDWVTMTEVLEHMTVIDSEYLLDEVQKRTHVDSQVIITVPNRDYVKDLQRERWSWPDHQQFFDGESLHRMLRRRFRYVNVMEIVEGIWLLAQCRV